MSSSRSGNSGAGPQAAADKAQHAEIAPLELDFAPIEEVGTAQSSPSAGLAKPGRQHWLLPLGLLTLVAIVVFLLPRWMVGNQPAPKPAVADRVASPAPALEQSPLQQAQMKRDRQAAQDALEELLTKREELEAVNVAGWAQQPYEEILRLTDLGDEQYRKREFVAATTSFQQGVEIASGLLGGLEDIVTDTLQQGGKAIEEARPEAAKQAFELVLSIDSDNQAAQLGLERVAVLPAVLEALSAAERHEKSLEYSAAIERLEEVLALDAQRRSALQPRLAGLQQAQLDKEFRDHMSDGFRLLDQGQQAQALQAFNAAANLKPDAAGPARAIAQVNNARKLQRMQAHVRQAKINEGQEDWFAALAEYDKALAIDANLGEVAEQRAYAEQRAKMSRAIDTLNSDPLRLAKEDIFRKAQRLYAAGRQLDRTGPKLQAQLEQLNKHLLAARVKRPVVIRSDGQTAVSVQRVAQLGAIAQHKLELTPGRYVAIGVREGFRDVRREFVVRPGHSEVQVEVRCVEPI